MAKEDGAGDVTQEPSFASCVLYVHDDEDHILDALSMLHDCFSRKFKSYEIICVDDCSTDRSVELIKQFSQGVEGIQITLIQLDIFHGREESMGTGIAFSVGDFIFEFESAYFDFSSADIAAAFDLVSEGSDIVFSRNDGPRPLSSRLFYWVIKHYSNAIGSLDSDSFRVLSRRAINRVGSIADIPIYNKALYASCGLKSSVYTYSSKHRKIKFDSMQSHDRFELALNSIVLFTSFAYRVTFVLAAILMLVSLVFAAYTGVSYFGLNKPVEGWAPLMGLLSLGLFGLFFIMSFVIKYLDIILQLVFKKKGVRFSSIEKLK